MAALTRRGLRVAPFKVGPDFIDPGHHSRVTGRASRNLDGWMLSRAYNLAAFARHAHGADIAVVEGVMGLFDGYDGRSEAGSTAQMAKWLGLPIVLVVGARSMARSAAALVQGFERFDSGLDFTGVILNHLGSERHLDYLRQALADNVDMPVLGGFMRDARVAIPERHLGLVTREDHELAGENRQRLADMIESQLDLDRLLETLPDMEPVAFEATGPIVSGDRRVPIGVARDAAFSFYYPDNLELLEAAGAELVYFSPLAGDPVPENLGGIYLGGGYPELHAETLAGNTGFRATLSRLSRAGMPIYGECGGFMVLCREIGDLDGRVHPMSGCLPHATRMLGRLKALGYREVTLATDTILGPAGQVMRGHEFHYSALTEDVNESGVYRLADRNGQPRAAEGFTAENTLGSYVHLHFGSCPAAAGHFVNACRRWLADREDPPIA